MTKNEVTTLDDAFRYDGERCTETLKEAFEQVRKVHPDKPTAQQVIILHRALTRTYTEHPDYLFALINAVIGKFLIPELTPEERDSVKTYNIRSNDNDR